MARTLGSIEYLGRSRKVKGAYDYRIRKEFPPDPITGKREVITETVHSRERTQRAAEKRLKEIVQEYETGLALDADAVTFKQYAHKWLEAQENRHLAERTMTENRGIIRILCSTKFGRMKLKDIKPATLESLYTQLRQERNISNTTLSKYHIKIKQILRHAMVNDLLTRNVADLIDAPRKEKPNRRALTRAEATDLLQHIDAAEAAEIEALHDKTARSQHWCTDGISHHTGNAITAIRGLHTLANIEAVRIMLGCGLRLGETMALTWANVDTVKGKIEVCHSLTNTGNIKDTKTNRDRTIAIDGKTRMHLIKWRNLQRENLAMIGVDQSDDTPVICSDTGGYGGNNNFNTWWRSWRSANGFDGLRVHELRHTHFSLLLANGTDLKTAQERGGWASSQILLDVYAHAYEENDEAAADLFGNLLTEPEQSDQPAQAEFTAFKTA